MPSRALQVWQGASATALDEIENAHRAVGGPRPGRRVATLRLTQGYVLLLSAQFQRFCRDLHSESFAWILNQQTIRPGVDTTLLAVLTSGRALDRGNPTADNILRDFRPICPAFWSDVAQHKRHNAARRKKLELLNEWRNAIAHHDFTKPNASSERIWLKSVQSWRRACSGLAISFDAVVGASLARLVGQRPW
jgi:hypothetical protein